MNAVIKSVLADVSSVSPSLACEQALLSGDPRVPRAREPVCRLALRQSKAHHIHINLTLIHSTFYRHVDADQN